MKNILIGLLDWIYKKKCYFCSSSKECTRMCSNCYNEMDYLPAEVSRKILDKDVYCAGAYEQNLQKLIRGLKYHKQRDLAYFQAKFMFDYWEKLPNKYQLYQIVPVPLYRIREKYRKYNHMVLVAQEFSKLTGYEVNLDLVKRVKNTKPQYKLSRPQRMENLANAFKVDKSAHKSRKVLLLDDICTSGSTFESIILELQKKGIDDIVCFATTGVTPD